MDLNVKLKISIKYIPTYVLLNVPFENENVKFAGRKIDRPTMCSHLI